MPFSPEQISFLGAKLDPSHVKKNPRGYDYVEGWRAIAEANRIFGFDGWDRETLEMREVRSPEQVNGNWRVGFIAKVRITAGGKFRDGTGYGSGIAKDLGDAYESATKEAETDAMKRALMTFGNPFGLALYDKKQENVGVDAPPRVGNGQAEPETKAVYIQACHDRIADFTEVAVLAAWWNSDYEKAARRRFSLSPAELSDLKERVAERKAAIETPFDDAPHGRDKGGRAMHPMEAL